MTSSFQGQVSLSVFVLQTLRKWIPTSTPRSTTTVTGAPDGSSVRPRRRRQATRAEDPGTRRSAAPAPRLYVGGPSGVWFGAGRGSDEKSYKVAVSLENDGVHGRSLFDDCETKMRRRALKAMFLDMFL